MSETTERLKAQLESITDQEQEVSRAIVERKAQNKEAEQFINGQISSYLSQINLDNTKSNNQVIDQVSKVNEKLNAQTHHISELERMLKDTSALDEVYRVKEAKINECLMALEKEKEEAQAKLDKLKAKRKGFIIGVLVAFVIAIVGGLLIGLFIVK